MFLVQQTGPYGEWPQANASTTVVGAGNSGEATKGDASGVRRGGRRED